MLGVKRQENLCQYVRGLLLRIQSSHKLKIVKSHGKNRKTEDKIAIQYGNHTLYKGFVLHFQFYKDFKNSILMINFILEVKLFKESNSIGCTFETEKRIRMFFIKTYFSFCYSIRVMCGWCREICKFIKTLTYIKKKGNEE